MIYFTTAQTAVIDADPLLNKKFPRIQYESVGGTWTADTTLAGTNPQSMDSPLTYNFWQADDILATIELDFGSFQTVDSICIAGHNLENALVTFEYWNGASWVQWDGESNINITDANPIMFNATTKAVDKIRLVIDHSSENINPLITCVYVGALLVMERSIYGGHSPALLSQTNVIRPTMSNGGQFLGRTKIRRGYNTSYDFNNLTAQWYRDNFEPFVESCTEKPFFISWKPDRFPDETAYGWTTGDISPSNTGQRDLMSVSVPQQVYRYVG